MVDSSGQEWEGCSELNRLVFPKSIRIIGREAFSFSGLTEIDLPEGITSIKEETFMGCEKLISIKIPKSVKEISEDAFYGCTSLSNIAVSKFNNNYTSINNCLLSKSKQILYFGSNTSIIPKEVRIIKSSAFIHRFLLSQIVIPSGVKEIGSYAFFECVGLNRIDIPNSIELVGNYFLSGCDSLREVALHFHEPIMSKRILINSDIPNRELISLHVPIGSGYAYRRMKYFSRFQEIIPDL